MRMIDLIVFWSERANSERRGLAGECGFELGAIVCERVNRFVVDTARDVDEPSERGTVDPRDERLFLVLQG